MKKSLAILALLFSGIICVGVLLYFFRPQAVLPDNFDANHVRCVTISVFQPWIDKELSKKIEDAAGITTVVDAVHQFRYNRGSRHSDNLGGGWSITVEFAMKDGTFLLVAASVSGSEDAVEVIFSNGEKYHGTWPGVQTLWDSLNYPVQEG